MREAIKASRDVTKPWEELRRLLIDEYCGRYRPGANDQKARHLNLIRRGVKTHMRSLAYRQPKHDVESDRPELTGHAMALGLTLDAMSRRLNRMEVSRLVLLDALMGPCGIAKTGLRANDDVVKVEGRQYQVGEPYLKRIPFNRYLCDPIATSVEDAGWEGDIYDVPRKRVEQLGIFNPDILARIPSRDSGESGQDFDTDHESTLSSTERFGMVDTIQLIDIALYNPDGTLIVTMPLAEGFDGEGYLRIVEHQGAHRGPYRRLQFETLPDLLYGMPPATDWLEQANAFYAIVSKMIARIEAMKDILFMSRENTTKEAEAVKNADDLEVLQVTDPEVHRETFGGNIPELLEAANVVHEFFNKGANNPDIMNGSGTNTDKATIFSGLQAGAIAGMEDLGQTHEEFQAAVSRDLAELIISDENFQFTAQIPVKGAAPLQIPFRSADVIAAGATITNFNFSIRARSMGYVDPNVRLAQTVALMDTVFKGVEVTMASNGLVNVGGVARTVARITGQDDLEDIINDPILQLMMQNAYSAVPAMPTGPYAGLPGAPNPNAQPPAQPGASPQAVGQSARRQGQPQPPQRQGAPR